MQKSVDYSQAILTKYPEPVAIGIAKDPQGKHNPITLGWTMIVSHEPPMMAVAIGKTRYSLAAFHQASEFVLAFPSELQKEEALSFGTKSGRTTDKLAAARCPTVPASKIDSVLLVDAVANFECKVVSETEAGDHVIFVGEVVASHMNEKPLNRLYTVGKDYQLAGLPRV